MYNYSSSTSHQLLPFSGSTVHLSIIRSNRLRSSVTRTRVSRQRLAGIITALLLYRNLRKTGAALSRHRRRTHRYCNFAFPTTARRSHSATDCVKSCACRGSVLINQWPKRISLQYCNSNRVAECKLFFFIIIIIVIYSCARFLVRFGRRALTVPHVRFARLCTTSPFRIRGAQQIIFPFTFIIISNGN